MGDDMTELKIDGIYTVSDANIVYVILEKKNDMYYMLECKTDGIKRNVILEFIKFHLNHGTDTKNFHFCHGRTYFMQNIDGYFGTISKQLHEKMMEKLQKQFWYQMP